MPATKKRDLVLNLSLVNFENAEIDVGILEFTKERLQSLRDEHHLTHVFKRQGNEILSARVTTHAPMIGDAQKRTEIKKNLGLCAALIRNALVNFLTSINRDVLNYSPVTFSADNTADFFATSLPKSVSKPVWLTRKPIYEADIRVVKINHYNPFVGMVLNAHTSWSIDQTCANLLQENFSLVGLYVGRYKPNADSRVKPRLDRIGLVTSVEGTTLFLTDSRENIESIEAAETVLVRDSLAIERYLTHAFGADAATLRESLDHKAAMFRNGKFRFEHLEKVIAYLRKQSLEIVPGINFSIQPFFCENTSKAFPTVQVASKPTYVFSSDGRHTDTWHDRGLRTYGPYSYQTHTPTKPRVCVVCQASQKGRVEQFLSKLRDGIGSTQSVSTESKQKEPAFAQGLTRKYKLDGISFEFFQTTDDSAASYHKAVTRALQQQSEQDFKWDLAIVQVDERFHRLQPDKNPYFVTKAAFLSQQITVQEFEIETANFPDSQLGFALNNMALATYTKMNGVPWLMKANPTIAHEIVLGLGSASIGEGRFGQRERLVGITTVFSGDGNYQLSNLSRAVLFDDYQNAVVNSLKSTFKSIRQELNLQKREHVRLIFHSFKPFKDVEADAVKEAIKDLNDYDVELAFLHVVENHPFSLFDKSQEGVYDYKTRGTKGVYAPERGYFHNLSAYEVLLTTLSARDIKLPEHGLPKPILLKLHRNSTFTDMTYLARQTFTFCSHSWRSFFPSPMPVTILYSDLIANLLGNLARVPTWNPDVMLGRIGKTRWFL